MPQRSNKTFAMEIFLKGRFFFFDANSVLKLGYTMVVIVKRVTATLLEKIQLIHFDVCTPSHTHGVLSRVTANIDRPQRKVIYGQFGPAQSSNVNILVTKFI